MSTIASTAPVVVLDDAGVFRRYGDLASLIASRQQPESTRCVLNREGQYFHLESDASGKVALGRALGSIEFHSLRQQFTRDQHHHPELHRLLRLYPSTMAAFLESLFEELVLEEPDDEQPWLVITESQTLRAFGLGAVDRRVAHATGPTVAVDPFGHRYRPHTVRRGPLARRLHGRPLYIEIPR